MRTTLLFTTALIGLTVSNPAHARDTGAWDRASSIGRDVLVATAIGLPAVKGDWKGDVQAGASMSVALLMTIGLKEAVPERRPDGSDRKSFLSGHTSVSFAAAASRGIAMAGGSDCRRSSSRALSACPAWRRASIIGTMSLRVPPSARRRAFC